MNDLIPTPPTCRRCATERPSGTPEERFALGWGDGGTLCPACRAARNERATRATNRIVSGLAGYYASIHEGSRSVTVQSLPGLAIRSTWVAWGQDAITGEDARAMWAELGDGMYLVTLQSPTDRVRIAVQVEDGVVDAETITEDQAALLPRLARSLTTGGDA